MDETELTAAIADLKCLTPQELAVTLAGLEAAAALRAALAHLAALPDYHPDNAEDFLDLVADFTLDDEVKDFVEPIALVKAELATRAN